MRACVRVGVGGCVRACVHACVSAHMHICMYAYVYDTALHTNVVKCGSRLKLTQATYFQREQYAIFRDDLRQYPLA